MKLRTYISGMAVVAGLGLAGAACGPDAVNNYYGAISSVTPNGRDGQFTCADAGNVEYLCTLELSGDESKDYLSFKECATKACSYFGFSQDCIECMVSAGCVDQPKESGLPQTPWELCAAEGACPPEPKEWYGDVCPK